jgi:hypothetical protein
VSAHNGLTCFLCCFYYAHYGLRVTRDIIEDHNGPTNFLFWVLVLRNDWIRPILVITYQVMTIMGPLSSRVTFVDHNGPTFFCRVVR